MNKRFENLSADAKDACRDVAKLLDLGKDAEAKAAFSAFCANKRLVLWEAVALADYVATQRANYKPRT